MSLKLISLNMLFNWSLRRAMRCDTFLLTTEYDGRVYYHAKETDTCRMLAVQRGEDDFIRETNGGKKYMLTKMEKNGMRDLI